MNDEKDLHEKIKEKILEEQKELGLWKQIKEDFTVPKLNDPALDSSFELFLTIQEYGQLLTTELQINFIIKVG